MAIEVLRELKASDLSTYPARELAINDLLHFCEGVSNPSRLLSSMLGRLTPKPKSMPRRGARTSQNPSAELCQRSAERGAVP
eukprot:944078-Heterocapsa_arctica.AAC.1